MLHYPPDRRELQGRPARYRGPYDAEAPVNFTASFAVPLLTALAGVLFMVVAHQLAPVLADFCG